MQTSVTQSLMDAFKVFFPYADGLGSYAGGRLLPGDGPPVALQDPATGRDVLAYADAGPQVVEAAAQAAQAAQAAWAALPHAQRGRIVFAVGAVIRAQQESLARLESINAGKPVRDCRVEVAKVAEMFEYYGGWADKFHGQVIPVPSGHLNYTRREPMGVVLQITPWNAPIFTCGWQVAPAIAMGNGVLLKPSELTPCTSLAVAMLAEQAGVPAGLINVLAGYGHTTGQAAIGHAAVRKVVFVGSPATGKRVAAAAAERIAPCVLELGGKSANIVFDDANLEKASQGAQAAIFSAAGQSCVAGSRLLVQRSIYERFVAMVAQGADRIRVGPPQDDKTEVGPIANSKQYAHVQGMIQDGLAAGAVLASQSADCPRPGFYVRPTVLSQVSNSMRLAQEEVFGPVLAAIPFDTEEEAVSIANDTRFGLAGAVWTGDTARAHRVAAKVKAGTFWINAYKIINVASPFGGYGDSGYGRSSGMEALYEYTQTKSVWVETAAETAPVFGYAP